MKNLLLILALFVGNIFSLDYIVCDIEEDYFSDKLKKEYGRSLSGILDSNEKYSEIFIELDDDLIFNHKAKGLINDFFARDFNVLSDFNLDVKTISWLSNSKLFPGQRLYELNRNSLKLSIGYSSLTVIGTCKNVSLSEFEESLNAITEYYSANFKI
tara:strand:+ start:79 stop:549 length:471 start_codon:yes stop_codon:yes gene_type:complete